MVIKVLGSGCKSCTALADMVQAVADRLGIEASVEKVTDLNEIMGYGIMTTPGLVIDEKVKAAGRIPKIEELERMLTEAQ
jgi:small redox-active disulfide protein 2